MTTEEMEITLTPLAALAEAPGRKSPTIDIYHGKSNSDYRVTAYLNGVVWYEIDLHHPVPRLVDFSRVFDGSWWDGDCEVGSRVEVRKR